ncbi:MAG: GNAT family N-acetyltransferase [Actinobacteria bacterium]|nr:GNAT family N-acetyltransferase [Actinomycetota bacterium]
MRTMTCHCGAVLADADTAALVEPVFTHFHSTHPELGLSRVSVRNYLDAEDRSDGATAPVGRPEHIDVLPITPDRADDIIEFFDRAAFADNPAWGSCYCMFYFLGGGDNPEWGHIPWQETRETQHDRLREGKTTGMVASVDGQVVAWCNATARSEFPGRVTGDDDHRVCSVVCFVVAPPYRRHRLATMLLDGAVESARAAGFRAMEAYPRREPQSAASAYVGPLDLYLRAGFIVTSEEPLIVGLEL